MVKDVSMVKDPRVFPSEQTRSGKGRGCRGGGGDTRWGKLGRIFGQTVN